ncbi:MAG: hypothetical protein KC414_12475, partial [Romboutsia sp.]|nr:hypothetical protein [Romboutsia sp.]
NNDYTAITSGPVVQQETTETTTDTINSSKITLVNSIGKGISLPGRYKGIDGIISLDPLDKRVVFKTDDDVKRIGYIDEIGNQTLSDIGVEIDPEIFKRKKELESEIKEGYRFLYKGKLVKIVKRQSYDSKDSMRFQNVVAAAVGKGTIIYKDTLVNKLLSGSNDYTLIDKEQQNEKTQKESSQLQEDVQVQSKEYKAAQEEIKKNNEQNKKIADDFLKEFNTVLDSKNKDKIDKKCIN